MRHTASSSFRPLAFGLLASLPAPVFAQSAIAGVVRDTSGAVLPGVVVEACQSRPY